MSRFLARIGAWIWVMGAVVAAGFVVWRVRSLRSRVRTARVGAEHAAEAERLGEDVEQMQAVRAELERSAREHAAKAEDVAAIAKAKANELRRRGFEGMAEVIEGWNAGA